MTPRTAMILAIASGALAVALVAVDLQFGVHVELQQQVDGEWVSADRHLDSRFAPLPGCAGPDLRLVVDNDRLVALDVPIRITYWTWDGNKTDVVTVLQETWHIPARGIQVHPFVIPQSAFDGSPDNRVNVEAQVGDEYLGACAGASP